MRLGLGRIGDCRCPDISGSSLSSKKPFSRHRPMPLLALCACDPLPVSTAPPYSCLRTRFFDRHARCNLSRLGALFPSFFSPKWFNSPFSWQDTIGGGDSFHRLPRLSSSFPRGSRSSARTRSLVFLTFIGFPSGRKKIQPSSQSRPPLSVLRFHETQKGHFPPSPLHRHPSFLPTTPRFPAHNFCFSS